MREPSFFLLHPGECRPHNSGIKLDTSVVVKFCEDERVPDAVTVKILKLAPGEAFTLDVSRKGAEPELWTIVNGWSTFEVKLALIQRDIPPVPVCGVCGRSDGWTVGPGAVCTWIHLGAVEVLGKLTAAEVDRMRDVYASGPLSGQPTLLASLASKGWVEPYEGVPGAYEASSAAYGKARHDDGRELRTVLYLKDGTVNPFWRLPVGEPAPEPVQETPGYHVVAVLASYASLDSAKSAKRDLYRNRGASIIRGTVMVNGRVRSPT